MAKRRKAELDFIKSFVDGAYNRLGNALLVDTSRKYSPDDPDTPLGYCFKYTDPVSKNIIYQIRCSEIGIPYTDFRILMHEYGHIYLGHLDGIHEELDAQIVSVFRDQRGEIIDEINKRCGIDFADKLIERVIDDPVLNHSLHNIAMDMEVNSKVLSSDDVDEMEMDISSTLPKYREQALKYLRDKATDAEVKKQLDDEISKMEKEAKIKLILPNRYHTGVDDQGNPIPFPDGLTYAEYLILIICNLDQFVKMMVSIEMGGNGDTSQITQEMIKNALNKYMQQNQQPGKSDAYNQGYQDAMNDYYNGTPGQTQQQVNGQNNPGGGQQGQQGSQPGSQQQGGQQGQQSAGQGSSGSQAGQQGMPGQQGGQGGSNQGSSQPSGQGGSQQGQGGSQQGQGSGNGMSQQDLQDYNQGYQDGMNAAANGQGRGNNGMSGLSGLMSDLGMSGDGSSSSGEGDGEGQGQDGQDGSGSGSGSGGQYSGMRKDPTKDHRMDHRTESRDEADQKRKLGKIRNAGGIGCGDSGGPDATREVDKDVDEVEMALNEVMQNVKARVVKQEIRRDVMRLYNRGIIRSVIAPSVSKKITISVDPKIVYLIDISGSMDTALVDRILKSIGKNMRKLNRGLRYDIITWSTRLGEHIRDIDPKKGVPRISMGGGTSMASGIQYFKDNYGPEAILIVISDFEDYLEEWHKVEMTMPEYDLYGFNYGCSSWGGDSDKINWKNMKIRKFKH